MSPKRSPPTIEGLKVAAALKALQQPRLHRHKVRRPHSLRQKTMLIKVLAKHQDGTTFGVECASKVRLDWLRERVAVMQTCLPKDSYVVLVFPEDCYERSRRAVKLVDEVWITGKTENQPNDVPRIYRKRITVKNNIMHSSTIMGHATALAVYGTCEMSPEPFLAVVPRIAWLKIK